MIIAVVIVTIIGLVVMLDIYFSNLDGGIKLIPSIISLTKGKIEQANMLQQLQEGEIGLVTIENWLKPFEDQKIVRGSKRGVEVLVESVDATLPNNDDGSLRLEIFAQPAGDDTNLVIFSIHDAAGDFEGPQPDTRLWLISFDLETHSFTPLKNLPDILIYRHSISPDQRRIAYAPCCNEPSQDNRSIWIYDIIKDETKHVITLPKTETLISDLFVLGVALSWKDQETLQYNVYREGEKRVLDRKPIDTRVITIPQ